MSDIVRETDKKEYSWIKYIRYRIRRNKNFLCMIAGSTGSGKSWTALSIGEMLDPDFCIERVIFRGKELMNLINSGKLKKGSVIIWDEAGIDLSSRNWQSVTNKMLNYLLQTFRHKCFILFFTCPYMDFLDSQSRKLFHAEFTTLSINVNSEKVKIKPLLIQYNAKNGKFYYKFLRVIPKGEGVRPIKWWEVPAPSKELIEAYESKKGAFTKSLNEQIETELNNLEDKGKKPLTEVQEEIVKDLIKGLTVQAIADKRGISSQAINKNIFALRKKGIGVKPLKVEGSNEVIGYEVTGYYETINNH